MKKCMALIVFSFSTTFSFAQLSGSVGFGSYSVSKSSESFRGYGPTVGIAYTGNSEQTQAFLDASLYKKSLQAESKTIFNSQGEYLGSATSTKEYTLKHFTIGFKRALFSDFTETRFGVFLEGGGSVTFLNTNQEYSLTGFTLPSTKLKYTLYGFHFGAGLQARLEPIVVQLRTNFNLGIQSNIRESDDKVSNILAALKLGVLIPITKR